MRRADETRWPVRTVPEPLRERYLAHGWWTDDTLGALVDRSLGAAPTTTINVWSESRPWHGTFPRSDRKRSGSRPRSPRPDWSRVTSSPSSCRTGARPWSRSTGSQWVATSLCRSCTSTATRRCGSSSPRAAPAPTSPRTASGTWTTSTSSMAPGRTKSRTSRCTSSWGRPTARPRAGAPRWMGRRRRGRSRDHDRGRAPRRRVRTGVYVRHDERPQGGDAHPPDAAGRTLAHAALDPAGTSEPHGLAGDPRDRHAGRGPRTDERRPGHPPHRPVGPDARPAHHARGRHRRGHRRLGVPRQHPRSSGLHPRARATHVGGSDWAAPRCRWPSPSARRRTTSQSFARTAPPSTHRSPAAPSTIPSTSATPPTAARCPASRSGCSTTTASPSRPVSPVRSGHAGPTCASATPIRRWAPTPSTTTAGTAPATWASSTPTASSRSPTV